ncbi:hypothetical protein EG68_12618 [Paragonimus skrjabini miyazakii]|uniref:Uncharacterized protein n=1 Tax=Paragonimus skrjabini miyazakii TaxID=59628 RepID=A0A8S9YC28_9TREM|nr:hypothetical protein EG68_12618 [Paragonimus skrjabini miyazakii]
MEQQFNRRHGATNRTFSLGQLVLAKDYHDGVDKWTAGRILRRTGRVTYEVRVQSSIQVRHANQLHPSFQPVIVPFIPVTPPDIPLNTLDLPQDFSATDPNRGASYEHLHTQKMDGSFPKTSCEHADESSTTILKVINSMGRC